MLLDTSESLNFLSPSSTREDFTAGIAERCRKLQQPQPLTPKLILNQPINRKSNTTTAYFDIESGKINTIVSRANGSVETNGSRYFNSNSSGDSYLSTKTIELASPTVVAHANKKPSYLNLACCVNGYSNYTTYDSQERKDINKSREVSPIRPIINSLNMSRQQRSNDNLLVPNTTTTTFIKTSPLASITTRFSGLIINGDKDTTDNAGMNGSASVDSKLGNRKSFIQQRVEKLYGLNSSSKIITTVKSTDSLLSNGNGHAHNGNGTVIEEKENDEDSVNSLPVMKHLRPEFAKQLKFCNSSPKKSSFKSNGVNGQNGNLNSDISAANVVTSNVKISLQQQTNTESLINAKLQSELELNEPVIVANMMVSELEKENVPMAVVNGNGITNNGLNKIEAVGCSSTQGETKDGHYFLQLLNVERNRILKMADDMEKDLELAQADVSYFILMELYFYLIVFFLYQPSIELSEDMIGLLLAAIGKSRLLATKKFKQFEGESIKFLSDSHILNVVLSSRPLSNKP